MIDPVVFRDVGIRPVVVDYVEHLLFRQLCATVCRPFVCSAPEDLVQHVVLMGARLQMPRVDAERVIAAVTNYQPFTDPAVKVFVGEAMRRYSVLPDGEGPVGHIAMD